MKNPFEKQDNSAFIATVLIGSIAAGAIAYLYLTQSGSHARGGIKRKLKEKAKNAAAGAVSKKTGISKKLIKKAADHVLN